MRFSFVVLVLLEVLVAQQADPAVTRFLKSPELKTASVGICVVPLDGEASVMEWQADTALIPASTMKAITTATALQVLGPDDVFETRLYLKGNDLVIQGGGDPTVATTSLTGDFVSWFTALQQAGVTSIQGDLIADPSRFESRTTPNDWPWGDVGNYYGAGPSGLNFHLNSFALTFQTQRVGAPAPLIKVSPMPPGVTFENHMLVGSPNSGDQGYVYGGPGARVISMRGTVPQKGTFTIRGALPDPPLMCVTALRDFLRDKGMVVRGKVRVGKVDVKGLVPIHVQKSPTLAKIAKATNYRSVNLYADSIFKALTSKGTTKASAALVKSHWEKQGIEMTGFVMHDGSGLSPRGTVTARQLAMILKKARSHASGAVFYDSLPVAGRSGTMAGFGNDSLIEGRLRAKSGSLTRVKTYAGYFTAMSGRRYAFAILTNNAVKSPKTILEQFLDDLVKKS